MNYSVFIGAVCALTSLVMTSFVSPLRFFTRVAV